MYAQIILGCFQLALAWITSSKGLHNFLWSPSSRVWLDWCSDTTVDWVLKIKAYVRMIFRLPSKWLKRELLIFKSCSLGFCVHVRCFCEIITRSCAWIYTQLPGEIKYIIYRLGNELESYALWRQALAPWKTFWLSILVDFSEKVKWVDHNYCSIQKLFSQHCDFVWPYCPKILINWV